MSGEIKVSSSTDSQQQVNEAARYGMPSAPEEKEAESSEAEQAESAAESEPAEEEENPKEEEEEEEGEDEEEEEEEGSKARHPDRAKRKLQRKVSRLLGQRFNLQEQLTEARERIRKLEEGTAQAPPATPQGKPDPKDPKYKGRPYEDFVEDLADWKVQQKELAKGKAEQEQFLKQIFDDYNHQVEAARDKFDDFDEAVGKDTPVPQIAINAMYEMDNGAEVAYYLAKHADVRQELLQWNQPGTKGGIRKILSILDGISEALSGGTSPARSNGGSPKPRPVTTAPPAPIKPLGGASASRSATVDPGKMSYQDYKRWYQKTHGTAQR